MTQKISATIITKNEATNIEATLKALDFVDEIIIVDSHSTDATISIAEKYQAKVFQRDFKNYGNQKNNAADLASGPWILNVDADEVVSPELKESIRKIINQNPDDIFELDRLNYYCGKPIKFGGWYPDYNIRLYKKDLARWTEPHVHERLEKNDKLPPKRIEGKLHHYTFSSIEDQVNRNTRYAKQGASDLIEKKGKPSFFKVIARPVGKFFELYFLKLGFLDGKAGFIIALNAAYSLYLKYLFAHQGELS